MIGKPNFLVYLFLSFNLFFTACKTESKKSIINNQEITFSKEGELHIMKPDSTVLMQIEIEIADNTYEIETGLMYRSKMRSDRGMLFLFSDEKPRYFYMKNTQIPLDILYINEKNRIVSIFKNATPFDETTLPASDPAKYVLEINAGLIDKHNISEGDIIWFIRN